MSLMDALRSAQTSLQIGALRSATVASNVGRAGEEGYAQRDVPTATDLTGARALRVRRAHDAALESSHLAARTASSGLNARASNLDALRGLFGGPDADGSPNALMVDLRTAMQRFASAPSSVAGATSAIDRARDLANGLNRMESGIAALRTDADSAIARDVETLRGLLAEFGEQNGAVVAASRQGRDGSDAMDARARTLNSIADLVGVRARVREHGDMVLFAGGPGGPVLHEAIGRPISFQPSGTLTGTSVGAAPTFDGQAIGPGIGGRIGAALALRDESAPQEAERLDAIAAALVDAFRDMDGVAGAPGLFTDPAPGTPGAAGRIALNAAFDPDRGGDPFALRDGGAGGAVPQRNPNGNGGFAALLIERIEGFSTARSFAPALGLGDPASLLGAGAAQIGQIDRARSDVLGARDGAGSALERIATAHSNATGVNVDREMALLIEIEQSHRASARIIAVVDRMLDDLLNAAR